MDFLDSLNGRIARDIGYLVRDEPGVQSPARTTGRRAGSCRDMATLFVEAFPYCGLASRFVSGYLVFSAAVEDQATTHAWAEIYLPGADWRGYDSTSGQRVGGDHIAVAVHRRPEAIPVSGRFVGPRSHLQKWMSRCRCDACESRDPALHLLLLIGEV